MNASIEVYHLGKRYVRNASRLGGGEEFWALNDVNLKAMPGDILGIVGANGAGKSTLLKVLSRITPPTTGKVRLRGKLASLLEVGTGFHPELTGRDNIYLNGALLGMRSSSIRAVFDEVVDFSGVGDFLDTPVKHYSSGMYVRLAFSVAAHLQADILVVDEVLAVGDAEFQRRCLGKMDELSKGQGRTVLLVSHNQNSLLKLCNSGVYLHQGVIQSTGSMEQVLAAYNNKTKMEAQTLSLANRTERTGEGMVQLAEVRFSSNGQPVGSFKSGNHAQIWLRYAAKPGVHVRGLNVRLNVLNEAGQRVTVLSNRLTGSNWPAVENDGWLCVTLDALPLMPGNYWINAHVLVGDQSQDFVQHAFKMEVEDGDYFRTGDAVLSLQDGIYVPHRWEVATQLPPQ